MIHIGLNGRFFPNNWRPATQEIAFAADNDFAAIQFRGPEEGLGAEQLGATLDAVAAGLHKRAITPVMEIMLWLNANGFSRDGNTPLDALRANLPAIDTLGCACVHWHLGLRDEPTNDALAQPLEDALVPQFAEAVDLATAHGFRFGFEHNEAYINLFRTPERCARLLDAVPGLCFTWDFNHGTPAQIAGYKALATRAHMLHVSDTPLPAVNFHQPLGQGNVDFVDYCRTLLDAGFDGPAILEIGGHPKSGGFGQDTDAALRDSRKRLAAAIQDGPRVTVTAREK